MAGRRRPHRKLAPPGGEVTYNLGEYNRLSFGREKGCRGGGILVYIQKQYKIQILHEVLSEVAAENIVFRITNTSPQLTVSAVHQTEIYDTSRMSYSDS